jgi:tetratricopeptide (TPR) repeat protein
MQNSIFLVLVALLLSSFSFVFADDPKVFPYAVGDFEKTLPAKGRFANSSPKILKMDLSSLLKNVESHIKKHRYEKAIRILEHRLESEPTNERVNSALINAHKAFAEDLCLRKEFEKATVEYKAAISLMSTRK